MGRTPEVSDYVAMTISSFIANLAVGGLLVLRKANLREIAFPGVFLLFAARIPSRLHDWIEQAMNEFARALEFDPRSSDACAGLGKIYSRCHDLEQTAQVLKGATGNAPMRSIRRMRHAIFKLETGEDSEAKKILDEMTDKALE